MQTTKQLLLCGGAGGHMPHPYNFATSGNDLLNIFKKSVDSLKKNNSGSVKIDGINASIRFNGKQFVLDRGSAKPLDIQGVTLNDLEARFGSGHGFIGIGKTVLSIFNESIKSCFSEIKALGMLDPNVLLNIEYIEGQTNLIKYNINNFLAINDVEKMVVKTLNKDGTPRSRMAVPINYNTNILQSYINKLDKIAKKYNFKVIGSVDTVFKQDPNFSSVLSTDITLYPNGIPIKKSLREWLNDVKYIPSKLITKKEFLQAIHSKNLNIDFKGKNLQDVVNSVISIISTIKLGNEILRNITSELGDLESQEGIVVRDKSIFSEPFKITGNFILSGLEGKFAKK